MVNVKKAKILFRASLFGVLLCFSMPFLFGKLGYEFYSLSSFYGMFYLYSLAISIGFHFLSYGNFLMSKTKDELLENLDLKGSLSSAAYMLLFWNMVLSLFCFGLFIYSYKERTLIGIEINRELLLFFVCFGLFSFYLVQKDRLGKKIGYLVCRYY